MANEILKDEILSEEDLDNVAGGTVNQTASDSQFLRDIGINEKGWGNTKTSNFFDDVSKVVADGWAKFDITCTTDRDGNNTYNQNGKEITREAAYKYAMKETGKHFALSRYGFKTGL